MQNPLNRMKIGPFLAEIWPIFVFLLERPHIIAQHPPESIGENTVHYISILLQATAPGGYSHSKAVRIGSPR